MIIGLFRVNGGFEIEITIEETNINIVSMTV